MGLLTLLLSILYVVAINVALKAHAKEDQIILGSLRTQDAINAFIQKHGGPPQHLELLIPDFIPSIPALPEISKVDYQIAADGKGWTLNLYRSSNGKARLYRRTNLALSPEDSKRLMDTENGCYILRLD